MVGALEFALGLLWLDECTLCEGKTMGRGAWSATGPLHTSVGSGCDA